MHLLPEIFTFSRGAGKCFYPNFTDEKLENPRLRTTLKKHWEPMSRS